MKSFIFCLLVLVLVCVIGLMGCFNFLILSGNYLEDILSLINSLKIVIELLENIEVKSEV